MSMTEKYANRGKSSSRRPARLADAAVKFPDARHLARKLFVAEIHRQQAEFFCGIIPSAYGSAGFDNFGTFADDLSVWASQNLNIPRIRKNLLVSKNGFWTALVSLLQRGQNPSRLGK